MGSEKMSVPSFTAPSKSNVFFQLTLVYHYDYFRILISIPISEGSKEEIEEYKGTFYVSYKVSVNLSQEMSICLNMVEITIRIA